MGMPVGIQQKRAELYGLKAMYLWVSLFTGERGVLAYGTREYANC